MITKLSDKEIYSNDFYRFQSRKSYETATIIVPIIRNFVRFDSVVDFGCGVGTWLKAFEEAGTKNVIGFEGSWVQTVNEKYHQNIVVQDLNHPRPTTDPYDLAVSLEVAEHLHPSSAVDFVGALCDSAPIVLFSAAIPGQGGAEHINEQWQDYWVEIFASKGFQPYDIVRPLVRNNNKIPFWYRQNMLLFAKRGRENVVACHPTTHWTLNYVDPDLWQRRVMKRKRRQRGILFPSLRHSFSRTLSRLFQRQRGQGY